MGSAGQDPEKKLGSDKTPPLSYFGRMVSFDKLLVRKGDDIVCFLDFTQIVLIENTVESKVESDLRSHKTKVVLFKMCNHAYSKP